MSNLIASLRSSSSALDALEQSVSVSQNNVMNASTPGYVRQRMGLKALDFLPDVGLFGGVSAAGIQGARDQYAEQAVRSQVTRQGAANQSVASLSALENAFPMNTASGIPAALNRMFQSFTAWSVAPNSTAARQDVIATAETVAQSFRQVAGELSKATTDADRDLRGTIEQINNLGQKLGGYNLQRRQQQSLGQDAGLDAQIHETLEQLAGLVDFQALHQEDGTITVLIAGQVPLVVGEKPYSVEARFEHAVDPPANAGAAPAAKIYDSAGREITALAGGGKLGSLLEFRNKTLPHLQGDGQQEGELNRLAKKIADRVNEILTSGYPPPQNPLFVYGTSAISRAHTISVNPSMVPTLLAAVEPGPPPVANGKPVQLSALANPESAGDKLDDLSLIDFYGGLSATAGRQLANAKAEQESQASLVAQARSFREQVSGVSLDEEAVRLVEYQRAYQASARMVSVLDELTEVAVNLIR